MPLFYINKLNVSTYDYWDWDQSDEILIIHWYGNLFNSIIFIINIFSYLLAEEIFVIDFSVEKLLDKKWN